MNLSKTYRVRVSCSPAQCCVPAVFFLLLDWHAWNLLLQILFCLAECLTCFPVWNEDIVLGTEASHCVWLPQKWNIVGSYGSKCRLLLGRFVFNVCIGLVFFGRVILFILFRNTGEG